jgi:hypothetical protein
MNAAESVREVSDVCIAALARNCRNRQVRAGQQGFCAGASKVLECHSDAAAKRVSEEAVQVTTGYVRGGGDLRDTDSSQRQVRPLVL